jgi:hypothetical protein
MKAVLLSNGALLNLSTITHLELIYQYLFIYGAQISSVPFPAPSTPSSLTFWPVSTSTRL